MLKKSLILMNMGGATTKAELEMFLLNMFRDPNILTIRSDFFRGLLARFITKKRLDASWANYEKIGGSPLPRITDELVAKLTEKIGNEYLILPIMCYTKPGNEEVIAKLIGAGITEIILFPLYPHYSTTTVKSSVDSFLDTMRKTGLVPIILNEAERSEESRVSENTIAVRIIEPFYRNERYNNIIIEIIKEILWDSPMENDKNEFELIFSAHGLPEKIVKKWDPYQSQIEDHVAILARNLEEKGMNFAWIHLAYQSRVGPMKWIWPSLHEKLSELSGKKVIIFPLSFTVDNSETKFELDIEYREIATEHGISEYHVCPCPNTRWEFQDFLSSFLR